MQGTVLFAGCGDQQRTSPAEWLSGESHLHSLTMWMCKYIQAKWGKCHLPLAELCSLHCFACALFFRAWLEAVHASLALTKAACDISVHRLFFPRFLLFQSPQKRAFMMGGDGEKATPNTSPPLSVSSQARKWVKMGRKVGCRSGGLSHRPTGRLWVSPRGAAAAFYYSVKWGVKGRYGCSHLTMQSLSPSARTIRRQKKKWGVFVKANIWRNKLAPTFTHWHLCPFWVKFALKCIQIESLQAFLVGRKQMVAAGLFEGNQTLALAPSSNAMSSSVMFLSASKACFPKSCARIQTLAFGSSAVEVVSNIQRSIDKSCCSVY